MDKNNCILPRIIRLRDIPHYLGMDIRIFNTEVRPLLTEMTVGKQGKAFDRLDLDKWVDYYKASGGRPPSNKRLELWDVKERQVFSNEERAGTLINKFSVNEFAKVLDQIRLRKRKSI
ncbi:conserved hypothetical protein [Gammaproteobacteria bacterium]